MLHLFGSFFWVRVWLISFILFGFTLLFSVLSWLLYIKTINHNVMTFLRIFEMLSFTSVYDSITTTCPWQPLYLCNQGYSLYHLIFDHLVLWSALNLDLNKRNCVSLAIVYTSQWNLKFSEFFFPWWGNPYGFKDISDLASHRMSFLHLVVVYIFSVSFL